MATKQSIIQYAVNAYNFLLWNSRDFTFQDLANAIKKHYEIDARHKVIVEALESEGETRVKRHLYSLIIA